MVPVGEGGKSQELCHVMRNPVLPETEIREFINFGSGHIKCPTLILLHLLLQCLLTEGVAENTML